MASLKVRDVAARLNVSEKTVYKWLAQGFIPATKLGRTWVITEEALEAVLATPGPGPVAPAPSTIAPYPARPAEAARVTATAQELAGRVSPRMRDAETSTLWSGATGEAIAGPLAGERLRQLPAFAVFWFAWADFYPGADIFDPSLSPAGG